MDGRHTAIYKPRAIPFPCTANYKHRIYRRNKKYLAKHKEDITPTACVTLLIDSIKRLQSLFEICRQYQREEKGQYKDLVETLANEQVATLLQRAVDAGLLDNHFQPTPDTKHYN